LKHNIDQRQDAAQNLQQEQASAMVHWEHSQYMMQPTSMLPLAQSAPQQAFGLPAPQQQQQGEVQMMEPGEAELDVRDTPILQAEQLGQMMQQQLTVQMMQTEHAAAGQESQHEHRLQAQQHQQQAQPLPGHLSRWPPAVFGGGGMPPTKFTKYGSSIDPATVAQPIASYSSSMQAWGQLRSGSQQGWIGCAPAAAAAEDVSVSPAKQSPASGMQPAAEMDEFELPELDELLQDIGRIRGIRGTSRQRRNAGAAMDGVE
jgi:hypothetical protein